jgi:glycosyltransferase involved in cell wall biosynthesis
MTEVMESPKNRDHSRPLDPPRRIRVAIVLEATEGGTREHIEQIARRIRLRQFRVSIIASARRCPAFLKDVERMHQWGLHVHLVPMSREIRPLDDVRCFLWLARHFSLERYDVVHTHSSKAGMLGRLAAFVAGVPRIVHTPHTFAFQSPFCSPTSRRIYRFLEQFAGVFTDRLVLLSKAQQQQALAAELVHESRTVIIPNGVATRTSDEIRANAFPRKDLGLQATDRLIGCVARLTPQKGHERLLQVAEVVCRKRHDVVFLLIGDGERRRELEAEIERLGLQSRVRLLGERNDVDRFYPILDALVLTSHYEGLPYTLLEAMAAKCPVVVFGLPDLMDLVIDGRTGLVAAPGQIEEMAHQILRLLDGDDLRDRITSAARSLVEEAYSSDLFIRRLEALYEGRENGVPSPAPPETRENSLVCGSPGPGADPPHNHSQEE